MARLGRWRQRTIQPLLKQERTLSNPTCVSLALKFCEGSQFNYSLPLLRLLQLTNAAREVNLVEE
jgi:hypothetical protein